MKGFTNDCETEQFCLDTGIRRYKMGGGEILSFNPADTLLISRMYMAMKKLDEMQAEYKKTADKINPESMTDEVFDFMEKMDTDMREIINSIFRQELSEAAFDGVGLYAYNRAGVPIWIAFFDGVMSRMETTVKKAQSEQTQRVEKLLAKYKRK